MTTKIQENNTSAKTSLRKCLALCLKGTLVGFGGILPGVSGGTLCAAFGMYHILLDALTAPFRTLKSHGAEIVSFVLGGGLGFLGLSGAAHRIMEWNASVVICVFIGLIAGTMPALWKDAGRNGRNRFSVVSMAIGFVIILSALLVLKTGMTVNIEANPWSFLLCGVIWGLSFVVPGLSSSTFLLFLGLYQLMLEGISTFSLPVLLPLAAGIALCLLSLPRWINRLFEKQYSIVSHIIIGIVAASTLAIFPESAFSSWETVLVSIISLCVGFSISFITNKVTSRLEKAKLAFQTAK